VNPAGESDPGAFPVVGFAISFPYSRHAADTAVEYVVNEVWRQQVLGESEPDFDEDTDE
jgi:hypothetical protein